MIGYRQLKILCGHRGHVVVHAVEGGYRAHCLECGALGAFCGEREEAYRVLRRREYPGPSGSGGD